MIRRFLFVAVASVGCCAGLASADVFGGTSNARVPTGACCFGDGRCSVLTQSQCLADGGSYQGDGVQCEFGLCPGKGACCFTDGSCGVFRVTLCGILGGDFQGPDSICAPGVCEECGPCEGQVDALTLRNDGPAGVIRVRQHSGDIVFDEFVDAGDTFSFVGTPDRLGPKIKIFVDDVFHVEIHTSCSQPIGVGQAWGDFVIVAGSSRRGGPLCDIDASTYGGDDDQTAFAGDIDRDGFVNAGDVVRLLEAWATYERCPEDLDGDGLVGLLDLQVLLGHM